MKTIRFFMLFLLVVFLSAGCVVDIPDTVTGNGDIVTNDRSVPEFTGIKVGSGIDVFITRGDDQKVKVEADENLQDYIRTEVEDRVLRIYTDKSIRMAKSKKVHITCKTLNKIDVSSAGDVTGLSRFQADEIDIELSSAGDLKFEIDAGKIDISLSSAGNAELKGTTGTLKAQLSSAGDLNAFEMEARVADVSVSSAGNARVFVTEEASFKSSSAGSIYYKGEPRIKEIQTSSAGSVNKK